MIRRKSCRSDQHGRDAVLDRQTSKDKTPLASRCRQFGNPTSEALHLGLNIDKFATLPDTKSKRNYGIARKKAVVLTN